MGTYFGVTYFSVIALFRSYFLQSHDECGGGETSTNRKEKGSVMPSDMRGNGSYLITN